MYTPNFKILEITLQRRSIDPAIEKRFAYTGIGRCPTTGQIVKTTCHGRVRDGRFQYMGTGHNDCISGVYD
jgi:hypothetical protein